MKRFSLFSMVWAVAALALAQPVDLDSMVTVDRTNARNGMAVSPPSKTEPMGLSPIEIEKLLINVNSGVVSDFYKDLNESLEMQADPNKIGEGFLIDFQASRDLPRTMKKADDRYTWAAPITSMDAVAMRLKLDLNGLEKDDEVYLVDGESLQSFGPFRLTDGTFWGPSVQGDTTILLVTSKDPSHGEALVTEGSHQFKALKAAKVCEDDLNCESSAWRQVAEAVGQYSFVKSGSTYVCSGTLLNPQDGSFTPYFLTANHCVSTQAVASTMHVYWDYRSTSCNSGVGVSKGGLPQTTGATLLSTSSTLDGTLVQLTSSGGSRTFAAWNATSIPANNSNITGIHHPAGDYMRVSKGTVGGTGQTSCGGSYVNEIRVNWIDSLTEGGSSGSGIFNDSYELVGDESGCGPENCSGTSAPGNYDWYSSFYHFYPQIQQYIGTTGGGSSQLSNGTASSFSLAQNATKAYTVNLPANVTNLTVSITGSGDADLYVKRAAINWPADQGAHNDAEFKSQYIGGSNESVSFTNPASGNWNVFLHGYTASSGSVTATWTVGGGGTPTWTSVNWVRETPHNYSNNQTYSYTYTKTGAQQVAIHFDRLNTEANYDFLRIKDKNGTTVFTVSGNLITSGSGSAFGRTDGWAIVNGDQITVELVTDYSVTRYGFKTDYAAYYQ